MEQAPLSFTGRRWNIHSRSASHDFSDLLAKERMIHRGTLSEQMRLSNAMLFAEMGRAVGRIQEAVSRKERVGIFGDYDADGITGAVQLTRAFRRRGIDPLVYLPHREREGYGLKQESIDSIARHNITLLITVDTGINAHEEIEYASSKGMNVIVTDHHVVTHGRPPAYAVLHPLVPSAFPNEHLTGSGVALMLVRALEQAEGNDVWEGIEEDLVLAAIGTVADMGALKSENRTLVMYGLDCARRLPSSSALKVLMDQARIDAPLMTSTDIGFRLAPRINASGRMADPRIAFDALLGDRDALRQLEELNNQRKILTQKLYQNLRAQVHEDLFLCFASQEFPAGIVGLLSGKLTEEFGRPSMVASVRNGMATASLRSVSGISVIELLQEKRILPHLLRFGGHSQAAGCTMKDASFPLVAKLLNDILRGRGLSREDLAPTLHLEGSLSREFLTMDFAKALFSLSPFGEGNPEPLFLIPNAELSMMRCVGNEDSHLSCLIFGKKGIGFGMGSMLQQLGTKIDLACHLSHQTWNGREEIQLVIKDIRKSQM